MRLSVFLFHDTSDHDPIQKLMMKYSMLTSNPIKMAVRLSGGIFSLMILCIMVSEIVHIRLSKMAQFHKRIFFDWNDHATKPDYCIISPVSFNPDFSIVFGRNTSPSGGQGWT